MSKKKETLLLPINHFSIFELVHKHFQLAVYPWSIEGHPVCPERERESAREMRGAHESVL